MTPAELSALIAGTASGQWIDGGGQTVAFSSSFVYSGALLQNFTFVLPFDGFGMRPQGSSGVAFSPTSALLAGQSVIPIIAPSAIPAGTKLFIISDDLWGPGVEKPSQWVRVKSMSPDGLTINLTEPLDYEFSINPKIYAPSLALVGAKRCKFIGSGAANTQTIFRPEYALKPIIEDCTFEGTGDVAIELYRCFDHRVSGNTGYSAGGARNYLLSRDGGCQGGTSEENTGHGYRHVDTGGGTSGVNRRYTVRSVSGYGSLDAIVDAHESTDLVLVDDYRGSFDVSANKDAIMMQGARPTVRNGAMTGGNGGIVWQPGTRLVDDSADIEGYVDRVLAGNQYALLLDNVKPAGNIASFAGRIRGSAKRGAMIKNRSPGTITKAVIDAQIRTSGFAAAIEQQAGAGAITHTEFRGQYERDNASAEAIQIYGAGVDGVYISGEVQGGSTGVNNINGTNVRIADGKRITGQSGAKTAGAVTMAVT